MSLADSPSALWYPPLGLSNLSLVYSLPPGNVVLSGMPSSSAATSVNNLNVGRARTSSPWRVEFRWLPCLHQMPGYSPSP